MSSDLSQEIFNLENLHICILAGGRGTRLAETVPNLPKPMAPIKDKPFLDYLIALLARQGVKEITLLTGHLSSIIEEHYKHKSYGITINICKEDTPLGTGGALRLALTQLDREKDFLVLNGDTFYDPELNPFLKLIHERKTHIFLRLFEGAERYGVVKVDSNMQIREFVEKGQTKGEALVNAGVYYIPREVVADIPEHTFISIENEIFPKLCVKGELLGIASGGRFIDIGIEEDYLKAQDKLPLWLEQSQRPCLFLDRDGIIIEDVGYPHKSDEMHIIEECVDLIKCAKEKGFLVICLSNQAGLAKGKFTLAQYDLFAKNLADVLHSKNAAIDAWYYCPYHPEGQNKEYQKESFSRKPSPGMAMQALNDFAIDLEASLFIGDKETDILAHFPLETWLLQGSYSINKGKIFPSMKDVLTQFRLKIAK